MKRDWRRYNAGQVACRLSEQRKDYLQRMADRKGMTMTALATYLLSRAIDKERERKS